MKRGFVANVVRRQPLLHFIQQKMHALCRPRVLAVGPRAARYLATKGAGPLSRQMMTAATGRGFQRVPDSTPIEEEQLPGYRAEDYYPVEIGQLLDSRYRILCKLGRGTGGTVWLARDDR